MFNGTNITFNSDVDQDNRSEIACTDQLMVCRIFKKILEDGKIEIFLPSMQRFKVPFRTYCLYQRHVYSRQSLFINQSRSKFYLIIFLVQKSKFSLLAQLSRGSWISIRPSTFLNIHTSETTGPIELKCQMETPLDGRTMVCSTCSGHMTKMATRLIYSEIKPFKVFSRPKRLLILGLGM